MRLADSCCEFPCEYDITDIPSCIADFFDEPISLADSTKRVYATIGQFTIIRLERDSQLLIPAYDYCMPEKECVGMDDEDPCALFSRINFPVDEFFPPDTIECAEGYREARSNFTK